MVYVVCSKVSSVGSLLPTCLARPKLEAVCTVSCQEQQKGCESLSLETKGDETETRGYETIRESDIRGAISIWQEYSVSSMEKNGYISSLISVKLQKITHLCVSLKLLHTHTHTRVLVRLLTCKQG